mmetsp:Transcript_367/g.1391  ORF Transcript_367/g.1391 Transcript_367/m.1391 type:complete len:131 (+) Transcript_367:410-802(+)
MCKEGVIRTMPVTSIMMVHSRIMRGGGGAEEEVEGEGEGEDMGDAMNMMEGMAERHSLTEEDMEVFHLISSHIATEEEDMEVLHKQITLEGVRHSMEGDHHLIISHNSNKCLVETTDDWRTIRLSVFGWG